MHGTVRRAPRRVLYVTHVAQGVGKAAPAFALQPLAQRIVLEARGVCGSARRLHARVAATHHVKLYHAYGVPLA